MPKVFDGCAWELRGYHFSALPWLLSGYQGKDELTGQDLALAFQSGVEVAYKAVMKPVEGTILTVSRGAAIGAKKKSGANR